MTQRWRQLRDAARGRLIVAGVDEPDRELGWMIERATDRTAAEQIAALDRTATAREAAHFETMVARRCVGEPLQYVIGRWGFRTLDLFVDQRVLIPRPETEVVAGIAVDAARAAGEGCVAVDLGTGSGAIALSLAAECWPHIEVWGTDRSPEALAVARANLAALGRRGAAVRLVEGDWFAALPATLMRGIDVVVSNPPYVPETAELPTEVASWEPAEALFAGSDGLAAIKVILAEVVSWLRPGGVVVIEIGDDQGPAVLELAGAVGLIDTRIEPDLTGRGRVLVASVRS